jgi:hypothetical protein
MALLFILSRQLLPSEHVLLDRSFPFVSWKVSSLSWVGGCISWVGSFLVPRVARFLPVFGSSFLPSLARWSPRCVDDEDGRQGLLLLAVIEGMVLPGRQY